MRKTLHLEQGSPEWHAHRATPGMFNASELAAVMNLTNKTSRGALLRAKAIGSEKEYSEWFQANVLNKGHLNEAAARPIAEELIGDDLSALVMVDEFDGVLISASLDGITQGKDITFEHKSLNNDLADSLDAGVIPVEYHPQMEAGLMVSGAKRCLFMASSDGNQETMRHCWYESNPALRAKIIAACKLFDEDVKNYTHVEVAERPAADVNIELPALFIQAKGAITDSNMVAYGEALKVRLAEVRAIQLVTDQDFSNAKSAASMFRDQIKKLKLAKEAMLAQTVSIGEAARMIDAWSEDLRVTALQLEKDVEREDAAKKAAIITAARQEIGEYVTKLNKRIGGNWMPQPNAGIYAEAIKGKRSYSSMHDAVGGALADEKLRLNEIADVIETNRKQLAGEAHDGQHWLFLFPDFAQVCTKAPEDFALLVGARIAAEEERVAAQREAIRKEEAAKAAKEAAAATASQAQPQTYSGPPKGNGGPAPGGPGESSVQATTASEAVAAHHDANDATSIGPVEPIIDDFLRLLAISPAEKRAMRGYLLNYERYKAARQATGGKKVDAYAPAQEVIHGVAA